MESRHPKRNMSHAAHEAIGPNNILLVFCHEMHISGAYDAL